MKMKTILATLLIGLSVVGCGTTTTEESVSDNTMVLEEAMDTTAGEAETLDTSDITDISKDDDNYELNGEVLEDGTHIVESMIAERSFKLRVPEGMEVHYSDTHSIELVRPFNDDVKFDYVDEEMGMTYHDEIVYADFNNIRNTPFVDSKNYLKAQLMNTGYNKVTETEIMGRNFIIAFSEINSVDSKDTGLECFPKTSICCLEVVDENTQCSGEEDCTHTEVIELLMYVHDSMVEDDVIAFVTKLINEGDFSLVKG